MANRDQAILMINTGMSGSPVWKRFGDGLTDGTIAATPKTYTRTYIADNNAQTDITGYEPKFNYSGDRIVGDDAQDYVATLFRQVGSAAYTEILYYNTWDEVSAGVYTAYKQDVTVQVDNPGSGAAGDEAKISGVIHFRGAAVAGTYTAATGVFTATTGATYLTTFVITNGAGATLTIGGETYTADANGVVGVALAAGTHDYTIMKATYTTDTGTATVSTAAQIIEVTLVSA